MSDVNESAAALDKATAELTAEEQKAAEKAAKEAAKAAKATAKEAAAKAAAEEAAAKAAAEADPWQEMRTIIVPKRYPKDRGRNVRVNGGVKYFVPCGKPVEVPLPVYDVLMHSITTRGEFEDMLDGLNGSDRETR